MMKDQYRGLINWQKVILQQNHILYHYACDKCKKQDSSLKCSAWNGFTKFLSKKILGPKKNFKKIWSEKTFCSGERILI